jgi:hypothetical protein
MKISINWTALMQKKNTIYIVKENSGVANDAGEGSTCD